MKKASLFVLVCFGCGFLPGLAGAAGTYYSVNDSYREQRNYRPGQSVPYDSPCSPMTSSCPYTQRASARQYETTNVVTQQKVKKVEKQGPQQRSGLYVNGGLTHEMAKWHFDMNQAGSRLNYSDLSWNVFDLTARYGFETSGTGLVLDGGFRYGWQYDESPMVDDDISNGGVAVGAWDGESSAGNAFSAQQVEHALSIGTSKGGTTMGFNVGIGLDGIWNFAGVRVTPSVGWRYFKYKLETKQNYGLSIDTINFANNCIQVGGEIQCDPALLFFNVNSSGEVEYSVGERIYRDDDGDGYSDWSGIQVPVDGMFDYVETDGTYYYEQSGVSHSYEVEWSGPYLALDMDYDINKYNAINARFELGLPSYTSTGDQPYRFDWEHSKSVEDTAGFGDAWHIGLGLNWLTSITDSVALSVGLTFDRYSVSDAKAKTYLSKSYYEDIYQAYYDAVLGGNTDFSADLADLESMRANGWVVEADSEVNSIYQSMGIRVGLFGKF